jgi:hypothetical protein
MLSAGFAVVFYKRGKHVGRMSLNRSEQLLHDYVESHRDERHYWVRKVQMIARESTDTPAAVARLDSELWRYYLERSEVAPAFMAAAQAYGLRRTSMKNLAEHLIRLWTEPKPRKPAGDSEAGLTDYLGGG